MSEFLYVYRGGNAGPASPEQMQKTMEKWMAWMQELAAKGHLKERGNPLDRTGKVVTGVDRTVTDGPYAESKDIVGGYTLVSAGDLDQAVALSHGCPIFENGGSVEVRPIMKM